MLITVYGTGYVGLVASVCLTKFGHRLIAIDVDEQRIEHLSRGYCPIYEKDLPTELQLALDSRALSFRTKIEGECLDALVHVIATGTPSLKDGQSDVSQVFEVVENIASRIEQEAIIVVKSTVPVGTAARLEELIASIMAKRGKTFRLFVVSNPEFLREGTAVADFLRPQRIVVGGDAFAIKILEEMYRPLIAKGIPFLAMSHASAELCKYGANAMLACKLSFINKLSQLADAVGADIDEIRKSLALDERIGPHFIKSGLGYGGSCIPKDMRALVKMGELHSLDMGLLKAVEKVNQEQKNWIYERINQHFKQDLRGLKIGVWGLAFKPETDDLREASSLVAISALIEAGAKIIAFDPVVKTQAQALFPLLEPVYFANSALAVLKACVDALVITTEWSLFKNISLKFLAKKLGRAPLFDGRNCFSLKDVKAADFAFYYSVGRPIYKANRFLDRLATLEQLECIC